jgi:hypothetical protein
MRKGRYKKNLLLESECPDFAQQMAPIAQNLKAQHQQNEISDAEFTAQFVLSAMKIIRPKDWKGSRLKAGEPQTALETFETFLLRGLPLSVNRSFKGWSDSSYPLKLFFEVPSIDQVLALQNNGVRCVTVLTETSELSSYVMQERDPVSFTLHDLIHADHFFRDPHQARVQVGFSRWLSELWSQKELRDRLERSQSFASQFEYACADMNSHGAHLVKYLKAIFCHHEQQEMLLSLTQSGTRSHQFHQALQALNTPEERTEHLAALEREFLELGISHQPPF